MKPDSVSPVDLSEAQPSTGAASSMNNGQSFDGVLRAASSEFSPKTTLQQAQPPGTTQVPSPPVLLTSTPSTTSGASRADAAKAYQQQSKSVATNTGMSNWQKYKDDQLLRNPGGRHYYLDKKEVLDPSKDKQSFFKRIVKDVSGSLGNVRNFVSNIFVGSKMLYRDQNNQIHETRQRGLLKTTVDFVKDMGSALTLGFWHPGEKGAPQGLWNRLKFSASKLKDAVLGDLVEGVPTSINHMGQNLVLAGLHLAQVAPDATIGNFKAGEKLTTTIFDNGHVMVEYLTDVIPSGDAWLRVHASNLRQRQLPVLYNLKMPEQSTGDTRWQYVRNTPLRKKIESIGALLADAAAIGYLGQTAFSSNRHHQVE